MGNLVYFINIYWYFSVIFIRFFFFKGFVILHLYLSLWKTWVICKACGRDCWSHFDCRSLIALAWLGESCFLPLNRFSTRAVFSTEWPMCTDLWTPTHATAVVTEVLKSSTLVLHVFTHFQNCSDYSSSFDFHFLFGQFHLYFSNVLLGFSQDLRQIFIWITESWHHYYV